MLAIAAVVTFVMTTVLSMAGVGAAFVLIPVFLALGVELHSAMPPPCCSTRSRRLSHPKSSDMAPDAVRATGKCRTKTASFFWMDRLLKQDPISEIHHACRSLSCR